MYSLHRRSDRIHGIVDVLLSNMLFTHNLVHNALSNSLLDVNHQILPQSEDQQDHRSAPQDVLDAL